MPTRTSTQREAQHLAALLALTPDGVLAFRKKYPRFAPAKWWDYQPTDSEGNPLARMQWERVQEFLREAWDDGFELDLFELNRLLLSVFDPADTIAGIFGDKVRPAFANLSDIAEEFGFHIGVSYLKEHPWAAKICGECKRPFAADIPQRRYCGLKCSGEVVRKDHLKYWHKKGSQQRKAKSKRTK